MVKIIKSKSSSVGIIPSSQLLAGRAGCVKSQAEGCGVAESELVFLFSMEAGSQEGRRKESRISHEHLLCAATFTFRILLSLSNALCSGHFVSISLMKGLETGSHGAGLPSQPSRDWGKKAENVRPDQVT